MITRVPFARTLVKKGFALVVTLSLMILLTLIAVGLLGLSAVSLRSSSQAMAQSEAQANARLALMIAIGELQKEMGPDMRISAESALFDSDKDTEAIEGVAQSRWMASYNAWGDWLNASYTPPGGSSLTIDKTYEPKRKAMFRRWLLSLPVGKESDVDAPDSISGWNNTNSVEIVGKGSLGTSAKSDQITRAWLTPVGKTGKNAWWISPENHKARIDKAKRPRSLAVDEWETAQGDTAEVGVGALEGFEVLDDGKTPGDKLITTQSLRPAQVAEEDVKKHFFDLTAHSQGVLASVRTGHLKKDLSLLFELNGNQLTAPYLFSSTAEQEPSIRPMSQDLKSYNPKIPMRHFQSWTNMRHYYRMYRDTSDANTGGANGTGGAGTLNWQGSKPRTDIATMKDCDQSSWTGSNLYWRYPVVAKFTFIFSLFAKLAANSSNYELYVVYTPVVTYWNPYNVELRIPSRSLGAFTGAPRAWPISGEFFVKDPGSGKHVRHSINDTQYGINYLLGSPTYRNNVVCWVTGGSSSEVVFKPGQLKVFSLKKYTKEANSEWQHYDMEPGFNPLGIVGGDMLRIPGTYSPTQEPAISLRFGINGWVFNINTGNTPGSLTFCQMWDASGDNTGSNPPMLYMHDWFRADASNNNRLRSESFTQITMDPKVQGVVATNTAGLQPWIFNGNNRPFAFAQLVLKGASRLDYNSIDWSRKDWRSRNWIQAPPQYNGSATYISEDLNIANTQRWDCPYSVNFGPLSGNMGDAVALVDPLRDASVAKFGSGAEIIENVSEVPAVELPTAPISSLAGFSGMRINPGWVNPNSIVSNSTKDNGVQLRLKRLAGQNEPVSEASAYFAEGKIHAYQSGVTGPGIGNSFMHPMLPRDKVYRDFDNSKSMDPKVRQSPSDGYQQNDLKLFRDYWDHVFLLNDALWDDYFVSSLANQKRGTSGPGESLSANIDQLLNDEQLPNSRYRYYSGGVASKDVKEEFIKNGQLTKDGYQKAAKHLVVDGMFNVNSTSVAAWESLFAGIRERQAVYRDSNGALKKINVPDNKIAITRFNTETSDQEMDDPELGVSTSGVGSAWSGVRFLDDKQIRKLAEQCVKQVKLRGPFLNFSEFINRRLSDDALGTMGALQSAIDYDDGDNPDGGSINFMFKSDSQYRIGSGDISGLMAKTPDAAVGSRFAGIPGYVIQSDLLKPIANTLAVRDDTFRIRAYGEALDATGKVVLARAWCEAIVQRVPEYQDPANEADIPARRIITTSNDPKKIGTFEDNTTNPLSSSNLRFGRKFRIESFRWLNQSEI